MAGITEEIENRSRSDIDISERSVSLAHNILEPTGSSHAGRS